MASSFQVVRYLIKSGADLLSLNFVKKTPQEEAEVALSVRPDHPALEDTVKYLVGKGREVRHFPSLKGVDDDDDDVSDLSSTDDDEEDDEDRDEVARFLGVSRSPSIQQAFQRLGLSPSLFLNSPEAHSRRQSATPGTESPSPRPQPVTAGSIRSVSSAKHSPEEGPAGQQAGTPTRPKKGHHYCPQSKVRLTYEMEGNVHKSDAGNLRRVILRFCHRMMPECDDESAVPIFFAIVLNPVAVVFVVVYDLKMN